MHSIFLLAYSCWGRKLAFVQPLDCPGSSAHLPDCADKSSTGRRLRVPHHLLPSLLHRQTHAVYCSRSRAPTSRRRCVVMSGWVEAVNTCWAGRSRMPASYREVAVPKIVDCTTCSKFRFTVYRWRVVSTVAMSVPRHAGVSTLLTPNLPRVCVDLDS